MGRKNFTLIPNGIPSLENRVTMLWTKGVCGGGLDLHRFVDCASTAAAKVFGLFPRKGTVAVGGRRREAVQEHRVREDPGVRNLGDATHVPLVRVRRVGELIRVTTGFIYSRTVGL